MISLELFSSPLYGVVALSSSSRNQIVLLPHHLSNYPYFNVVCVRRWDLFATSAVYACHTQTG